MKHTQFQQKIQASTTTPEVRSVAQKALSYLNAEVFGSIETDKDTFDKLCETASIKPIKTSLFEFIRIFDEDGNGVDIQTKRSLQDTLGDTIFKPYLNPHS
jgi:hypothetical protein